MLREGYQPPPTTIRVISDCSGLGDNIARLPAYRWMYNNCPHVSLIIFVHDYFLDLARFLLPENDRRKYLPISQAPFKMPKPYIKFDPDRINTLHLHLTKQAFLMLADYLPEDTAEFRYPLAPRVHPYDLEGTGIEPLLADHDGEYEDHKKYIVFTVASTAGVREWLPFHVNELAKRARSAGYTPVLLGSTEKINIGVEGDGIQGAISDGLDRSLFVDLLNRTTLIEALGIIQRSKAVVGVDNGLLHLAHCTDVPVVYGLTSLKPEHRIPYREMPYKDDPNPRGITEITNQDLENMELYFRDAGHGLTEVVTAEVPCAGCQSRSFFMNYDRRTCLFQDKACLLTMTADRFATALNQLGINI